MVPIQHLNTSQAETPLIQHLNQAEKSLNHGHLSQAEAPNDITERLHNINLNQSSNIGSLAPNDGRKSFRTQMQLMQKKLKYINVSSHTLKDSILNDINS